MAYFLEHCYNVRNVDDGKMANRGRHKATAEESTKEHLKRRFEERTADSRFQVQEEEDGSVSTGH